MRNYLTEVLLNLVLLSPALLLALAALVFPKRKAPPRGFPVIGVEQHDEQLPPDYWPR